MQTCPSKSVGEKHHSWRQPSLVGQLKDHTPHPSSYDLIVCRCFETWDELSPRTWEAFEAFVVEEDRAKENSPDERKEVRDEDYKKGIFR